MLTKAQKEIIDSITKEFKTINKKPEAEFSFINVGEIINNQLANETRLKEIEINNAAIKKLMSETLKQWVDNLNKDLIKLELVASLVTGDRIKINTIKEIYGIQYIYIYCGYISKSERVGNSYHTIYSGLNYCVFSESGHQHTKGSMEELLQWEVFQTLIANLYEKLSATKNKL